MPGRARAPCAWAFMAVSRARRPENSGGGAYSQAEPTARAGMFAWDFPLGSRAVRAHCERRPRAACRACRPSRLGRLGRRDPFFRASRLAAEVGLAGPTRAFFGDSGTRGTLDARRGGTGLVREFGPQRPRPTPSSYHEPHVRAKIAGSRLASAHGSATSAAKPSMSAVRRGDGSGAVVSAVAAATSA